MAQANEEVKSALDYLDAHLPEFQDQLVTLSRIPGLSSEPLLGGAAPLGTGTAAVLRQAGIENVQVLELPASTPTSTATG